MSNLGFTVNNLAISLPYTAEVGVGTSNTLFQGSGNLYVGSNLTLGTIVGGSNSPSCSLLAPQNGAYKIQMPSTSNNSNILPFAQNSLTISQSGVGSWSPAEFTAVSASLSNGAAPTLLTNTQLMTFNCVTGSNGLVTVYPTSTATASGTAVFPNAILSVQGFVWNNTSNISGVTLLAGLNKSSDNKTVTLVATQSTSVLLGGSALTLAPAGLSCSVTVIGY